MKDFAVWLSGAGRQSCEDCIETYRDAGVVRPYERLARKPEKKEPPCATCRPPLMAENVMAVQIYRRCTGDWNMAAMGGLIGLPVTAIESVMRMMERAGMIEPEEHLIYLDEVQVISSTVVKVLAEERREKDAKTQSGSHR